MDACDAQARARAGSAGESGRSRVSVFYWPATHWPVQETQRQQTCDETLESPEACDVQARAAHAKQKKEIGSAFDLLSYYGHCVHINAAPGAFSRMPAPGMAAAKRIEHGQRFRQTPPPERGTWEKAFRRDTAGKRQKPKKKAARPFRGSPSKNRLVISLKMEG